MKGIAIIILLGLLSCCFGQAISEQPHKISPRQLEIALNVFVTKDIFEIGDDVNIYVNIDNPLEKKVFEKSDYKLAFVSQRPKDYRLPYVVFKVDAGSTNEVKPLKFHAYQFRYEHFGSIYFTMLNQSIIFDRIDYISSID